MLNFQYYKSCVWKRRGIRNGSPCEGRRMPESASSLWRQQCEEIRSVRPHL